MTLCLSGTVAIVLLKCLCMPCFRLVLSTVSAMLLCHHLILIVHLCIKYSNRTVIANLNERTLDN